MTKHKSVFSIWVIRMGVAMFLLLTLLSIRTYYVGGAMVKEQLGEKSLGLAIAVATLIETDIESYREFINTLDTDSEYYRDLKENLEKILFGNRGSIAFIYAEVRVSEDEMMYIVDGDPESFDTAELPGTREELSDANREAYDTQMPVVGVFEDTGWGVLMSAYAPVTDSGTGEFVGLVGVDISIEQYHAIMRYQVRNIILSMVVFIVALVLLALFTSGGVELKFIRDNLTGAYNRQFFFRYMKDTIKKSQKAQMPLTVCMFDLDHFKNVNDTYGHGFGDVVLKSICRTITGIMRKDEVFARYGGEEFVAAFPGMGPEIAESRIDAIRQKVEESPIYNSELKVNMPITVSIGIASFGIGAEMKGADEMIEMADKALYQAKMTRNTVVLYRESGE